MVPGTQQMVLVHMVLMVFICMVSNFIETQRIVCGRIVLDANYLRSGILLLSHLPTITFNSLQFQDIVLKSMLLFGISSVIFSTKIVL